MKIPFLADIKNYGRRFCRGKNATGAACSLIKTDGATRPQLPAMSRRGYLHAACSFVEQSKHTPTALWKMDSHRQNKSALKL